MTKESKEQSNTRSEATEPQEQSSEPKEQSDEPKVLSSEEYERRKQFLDNLKGLTKTEYIEIVRILQKHSADYSENLNGVFFNCCNLPQMVFDDLELFLKFTQTNRKTLADREMYLSSLTSSVAQESKRLDV